MIYFAQDIKKRLIKIGYSQDVEKRLKHLSLEATWHQTHKHRRGERLYHYLRCLWTQRRSSQRIITSSDCHSDGGRDTLPRRTTQCQGHL